MEYLFGSPNGESEFQSVKEIREKLLQKETSNGINPPPQSSHRLGFSTSHYGSTGPSSINTASENDGSDIGSAEEPEVQIINDTENHHLEETPQMETTKYSSEDLHVLILEWLDGFHPGQPDIDGYTMDYMTERRETYLALIPSVSGLHSIFGREFDEKFSKIVNDFYEEFVNTDELLGYKYSDRLLMAIENADLNAVWSVEESLFGPLVIQKNSGSLLLKTLKHVIPAYFKDIDPTMKLRMMRGVALRFGSHDDSSADTAWPQNLIATATALKHAGPLLQKFVQRLESIASTPEAKKFFASFTSGVPPMFGWETSLQFDKFDETQEHRLSFADSDNVVSAGCISQVMEAKYDGQRVVVKLQRWNIEKWLNVDLEFMIPIIGRINTDNVEEPEQQIDGKKSWWSKLKRRLQSKKRKAAEQSAIDINQNPHQALFEQLSQAVSQEINFQQEYENILTMKQHYKRYSKDFEAVNVIAALPAENPIMLIFPFLPGNSISSMLSNPKDLSLETAKTIYGKLNGIFRGFIEEAVFRSGYFHADLHDGNLIYDYDKVTMIDFGRIGRLKGWERRVPFQLILAAFMKSDWMAIKALKKASNRASPRFNKWKPIEESIQNALNEESLAIVPSSFRRIHILMTVITSALSQGIKFGQNLLSFLWSLVLLCDKIMIVGGVIREKGQSDPAKFKWDWFKMAAKHFPKTGYYSSRLFL